MNRILPVLLLGLGATLVDPAQAAEIDAVMDLQLRCGVGYLLLADNPDMNYTAEEAASFERMGHVLLNHADGTLAEQGTSLAEREDIGRRYGAEMEVVLAGDDLGFDPEQCPKLVSEAEAATGAAALDEDIDKYMTCAVGFLAAARVKQEEGDVEAAAELEALGDKLGGLGDDLMVEAGYDEGARYQIGKLYGESVGAKFTAGEELDYDWDTCATLGI